MPDKSHIRILEAVVRAYDDIRNPDSQEDISVTIAREWLEHEATVMPDVDDGLADTRYGA